MPISRTRIAALAAGVVLAAVAAALYVVLSGGDGGGSTSEGAWTRPGETPDGTVAIFQPGPVESYYFEASVKPLDDPNITTWQVIKGWYERPSRTKWELLSSNPADSDYVRSLLVVSDRYWFYEPATNTYTSEQNSDLAKEQGPFPLPSNYQVGLLPPRTDTNQPVRTETYLDRPVDVYEFAGPGVQATYWVDQELGFVMRQVFQATSPDQPSFDARIEKLQVNPTINPRAFVFVPPTGSIQVTPSSGDAGKGGPINAPAGLLSPSYLPDGYVLSTSADSNAGGIPSYIERRMVNRTTGGNLTIQEQFRAGGLPESLKGGTVVKLKQGDGYTMRGGGQTSLLFYSENVIVTLKTDQLSLDELKRIAESMSKR